MPGSIGLFCAVLHDLDVLENSFEWRACERSNCIALLAVLFVERGYHVMFSLLDLARLREVTVVSKQVSLVQRGLPVSSSSSSL